ncbi:MAG TPA: lasso peptide biosynthesis B2 protein [Acidobacteriaceae bacterium]|nr:lasso peptide biosynthesis B2 protein [Acidobacteriaceae bacterium]
MQPESGVLSPEFELVLACVGWPIGAEDAALIRERIQRPIDWPHLLRIIQHHQVLPLVARNLEACAADRIPVEVLKDLRSRTAQSALHSFQALSELARLTRLFRGEQIELRILKGAPLAIDAFGDATLRSMGDLDMLVSQADLPRADAILRAEGYLRAVPQARLTPRRMRSYVAHQKDFSYENPRNGMAVDLHWRLFRNRFYPSNAGIETCGLAWTQLGPERIPTLPPQQLFLYLCVHGALDGWLRLKWIADIGALVRRASPEQLGEIARTAMDRSVLPEFSAAVLLCRRWLGVDRVPAECLDSRHPTVSRIVRLAGRLITSNDCCPVREEISSSAWFLNEFTLRSSLRYRAELIERSLFRPRVWEKVNLPDRLFPLYALFSAPEWLAFRMHRLLASSKSDGRRQTGPERKTKLTLLQRLFGLAPSDFALLVEAGVLLTFFRIALRFFSVRRLTAWMGQAKPAERLRPEEDALKTIRRIEWAVGSIARHSPLSFVCFPQSLAAYFMLRRRHVGSKLFYGVARDQQHLKAHTWIKVGDRTVVGGEAESDFTVLAIFP